MIAPGLAGSYMLTGCVHGERLFVDSIPANCQQTESHHIPRELVHTLLNLLQTE